MTIKIDRIKKVNCNNPTLIEGLPGMGNVGKISVDFIIESLDAVKIYEITSSGFPNCVFVDEKGLTNLPKIEVYYKKIKNNDFLFVSGDIQPVDEHSSYELCETIVDLFKKHNGKEIITLGGIGLGNIPKKSKLFYAVNDAKLLVKYDKDGLKKAAGVVGPIIGVSGLLLGIAKQHKIPATILLVETFGHPTYLGIKESREMLDYLNKKLKLNINIRELDKEIKNIQKEVKNNVEKLNILKKEKEKNIESVNYIG